MKAFILILTLLPLVAHALCENYDRYGHAEKICWNKEYKALVSEKCNGGCDAVVFLSKKNPRPKEIDRSGGKNPATQYCRALELRIVIMKDPRKAEQSFCQFPDGSLVDSNALARSLQ